MQTCWQIGKQQPNENNSPRWSDEGLNITVTHVCHEKNMHSLQLVNRFTSTQLAEACWHHNVSVDQQPVRIPIRSWSTNNDFTSRGGFVHDDNMAAPIIDQTIHHSHTFDTRRRKLLTETPWFYEVRNNMARAVSLASCCALVSIGCSIASTAMAFALLL